MVHGSHHGFTRRDHHGSDRVPSARRKASLIKTIARPAVRRSSTSVRPAWLADVVAPVSRVFLHSRNSGWCFSDQRGLGLSSGKRTLMKRSCIHATDVDCIWLRRDKNKEANNDILDCACG